MEIRKRKTRMYEPWGYVDENNYQGASIILDNDLESFFAEVSYNKDDNKIHFANKDGEEKATLDVNEFVKSDSIVEKAWYEDGKIYVKFTNGDVITVDVEELIDQNEFADGLQVNEGIVSVLIDSNSETFLSVSESGVKVSGVQDAINAERDRAISAETALDDKIDQEIEDRIADVDEEESRAISAETALDNKIDDETARASSEEARIEAKLDDEIQRAKDAETALDEKIDQEITDRIADVDEEETRATSEEARIEGKLDDEIQRAKDAEHALDVRIDTLNDALTNEKTRATAAEQELSTRLTTEIQDRKDDVDAEEARATSAETALNAKIDQEIADRINAVENEQEARVAADNRLQEAITSEVSRATSAETQLNNKIDQEIADREADVNAEEDRAKAAEEALDGKIEAETARATSAETTLQANITAEETARINRDNELTGLIEAEVVTARREETRIETKLDQEIADRKAEAIASAEYVKNDVKIYFKNDNGETLSTIDASDFIADGMIEDVQLVESGSTSVLVITWNTDGGSKVTRLDVGDIFEADNYYTKVQIDAIEEGLQDEIDAEEIRAEAAESALTEALAAEITRAQGAEGNLQDAIDAEEARAISAETGLNNAIAAEATTARAAEQANATAITAEQTRAEGAESNLQSAIADEKARAEAAEALKANAADVYTKGEVDGKETALQDGINSNTAAIAAEEARAENAEQVLQDNINAEEARAKAEEAKKVDRQVNGTNGKALIFNETDGGGAKFENTDGINSFVGVNDAGAGGIDAQIYAINKDTKEGSRLDVSNTGVYYTVGSDAPASRMVADNEIATKGNIDAAISGKADAETVYTKEDVDALLLAKENEIYNLTKIVGDMGGAVTYNLPNEAGKSFNTLMNNNGTVKLTDDVTTGRFGPGIIANNNVKLNLNNHDLNVTGLTTSSTQPAIMARGTQEITIGGKGTIDAGGGICIEGNGADSVINLTGSTTVYQTDRSGGELIYCYAGTINITNGTFKNNGENKKFLLNCYDANYRNGTAKIIVTGGKFYDFNPADNSAEGEHTSFVPEGYHVDTSTDGESTVYTVKKDA